MALEFDKEDLMYIKSTIEWMLENMQLKSTERIYTEDLHNLSMNSITALERGLALGFNEAKATLPINSVMGRFSDADVRNIVLDMQNATMHANSHNLNRFETRIELQRVKKKWGL